MIQGRSGRASLRGVVRIVLLSTLTVSGAARAQGVRDDPRIADGINLLERWVDAQREYEQIPGISLAVVYRGEILWSVGFGYSDLETRRPATQDTLYSICSISKLFTSIATMQLRDGGRLSLGDRVGSHLPWLQLAEEPSVQNLVSVEGLLTHTAGFAQTLGERPQRAPYLYRPTRQEFLALLRDESLIYRPGEHYNYSNIGMALLGEIVAEVSGEPYVEYVEGHILQPLGMSSTTPDLTQVTTSADLATGYSSIRRGGGRERVESSEAGSMIPAVGFASTAKDMAKFAAWQLRLLEGDGFDILEAETLREMYRVHYVDPVTETQAGLGFAVSDWNGSTMVGHAGTCPGFRSDLSILPQEGIAAVALTNALIPVWRYTARSLDVMTQVLAAVAADPDGGSVLPQDLRKYVGTYDGFPFTGEWQVVPWNGGLAVVRFPIEDPLRVLRKLESLGDGRFREVRDDGLRGTDFSFKTDLSGRVVRMVTDGYPRPRVRDSDQG